jgi:hypothetical protein
VTLLEAAGCAAMTLEQSRWVRLTRFVVDCTRDRPTATLGSWCQPLLAGDREALHLALG